jgi:hypothetical protein
MCVLLAMEAPRTLLDPPLAAVPFAQLARIKLQLVIMSAHLVLQASTAMPLLDKQLSRQAVLAHALLDTQRQEQARRLSRIAAYVMLAMEAPHRLLVAPLADATLAHLGHLKLLLVIVSAFLVLPVTHQMQQGLALSALLAIMAHHRLQIRAVLHSLLIYALPASLQKLEPRLIVLQVLAATAQLELRNLLQEIPHHVHLVLLAHIKLQQVSHLVLSAQLASTAMPLLDKQPNQQLASL